MSKFLVKAKYTSPAGIKGLLEDGGAERVSAVQALAASLGGKVEAFYFALGDVDAYVILEMPDTVSAVSASLTVLASGLATTEIIALVTPEEMDAAVKLSPAYDAPGKADN